MEAAVECNIGPFNDTELYSAEIERIPVCCGEQMKPEAMDFYSCPTCNGEAVFNPTFNIWDYDCPEVAGPLSATG